MNDINQRKEDFKMKIVAVGLGLIGGSMCKAIKKHTNHLVGGIDIDRKTVKMALSQNAIDYEAKDVSEADVTIVSLFPPTIISFIKENADLFKEGSIVIDTGGIKKAIVDEVTPILAERGVTFIGVHPMAGREFSGFEYSLDDLFDNASFIMTPTENTPQEEINLIEDLARSIHFKKVVKTTPEEHDRTLFQTHTSKAPHISSSWDFPQALSRILPVLQSSMRICGLPCSS